MALTETTLYDKIEVVGPYKAVQVRKRNSIQKDGVEIASNFERYTLQAGKIDASDNFVDNPLDKEPDGVTTIPDEVKNICTAAWTADLKTSFKNFLIANKPS